MKNNGLRARLDRKRVNLRDFIESLALIATELHPRLDGRCGIKRELRVLKIETLPEKSPPGGLPITSKHTTSPD
jgi:hypothetical protein